MNALAILPAVAEPAIRSTRSAPADGVRDAAEFGTLLDETIGRESGSPRSSTDGAQSDGVDDEQPDPAATDAEGATDPASRPEGTEPVAGTAADSPATTVEVAATPAAPPLVAAALAAAATTADTKTADTNTAGTNTADTGAPGGVAGAPGGVAATTAVDTTTVAPAAVGTAAGETPASTAVAATTTAPDPAGAAGAPAPELPDATTSTTTPDGPVEPDAPDTTATRGPTTSPTGSVANGSVADGSANNGSANNGSANNGEGAGGQGGAPADSPDAAGTGAPVGTTTTTGGPAVDAPTTTATHAATATPATDARAEAGERLLRMAELVDAAKATMRHRGAERIVLELHPAELGAVTIDLRLDGQSVNLSLRAGHPGAVERILGELAQLRQELADAGVNVGNVDVDSGQSGRSPDRDGLTRGVESDTRRQSLIRSAAIAATEHARHSGAPIPTNGRLAVDL